MCMGMKLNDEWKESVGAGRLGEKRRAQSWQQQQILYFTILEIGSRTRKRRCVRKEWQNEREGVHGTTEKSNSISVHSQTEKKLKMQYHTANWVSWTRARFFHRCFRWARTPEITIFKSTTQQCAKRWEMLVVPVNVPTTTPTTTSHCHRHRCRCHMPRAAPSWLFRYRCQPFKMIFAYIYVT